MGNCVSAKPATDEEKQAICKVCAKDMMNLCAVKALESPDKIKVEAPPALDSIRQASAELRKSALEVQAAAEAEGEAEPEEGGGGGGFGGMLGGMVGKLMGAASDVVDMFADVTAKGIVKALNGSADLLDKAVDQVKEPMTSIGKDIVTDKKSELTDVLKEFIKAAPVPNAVPLCMGDDPDAISKALITDASAGVSEKLLPIVGDKVKDHSAIKAWSDCIELYTKLAQEVEKLGRDNVKLPPVDVDIQKYICDQCAGEIGRLMGESEKEIRSSPANKGSFPDIFEKVFRKPKTEKDELLLSDYKEVTKEEKQ